MKVCAEPGCPALIAAGTRCEHHRKSKRRQADQRRPNARARGYDQTWERTRANYLAAFPICQWHEGCLTPAVDVHHLDGQGPAGPHGHDWANLAGLCRSHHAQTTARQQPGGFNQ